jgi:heat shock protein HslJ
VLLSGCGDAGDDEAESAGPPPFAGIPWVVMGEVQHAPTMKFEDGAVSGSTGCNQFSGGYTASGDTLEIGEVASTQMACPGPAMQVERAFLDTLPRIAGWRMDGDELVLADGDGKELLRLSEPSVVGDWDTTSFRQPNAVASPLPGTEITATFAQDGTLSGSAGCNRYSAGYTVDGGAIAIERPVLTRKACTSPDGVMEQEQQYVEALPRAASFTLEGERLTLLAADGTIIASYEASR